MVFKEHRSYMSVQLRRLVYVGPLTVLSSIAAVLIVRAIAIAIVHPGPDFLPLRVVPAILDTGVLVTWAVLVFGAVVRCAPDPIRKYKIIAALVLLLSFVPDIMLAESHLLGATWPYAFALMAMHVAAWATCVTMLTRLGYLRPRFAPGVDK
jgi:hypothetical protein